ncbi:hypothetical protein KJ766_03170, partial [Patescibacteria group bacterium]|nr:hypothetical protein [Patescibacteria group bacterium]
LSPTPLHPSFCNYFPLIPLVMSFNLLIFGIALTKRWIQRFNVVSLEKHRIEAVKEIAVSYYKSQPTTVNYNYIVK